MSDKLAICLWFDGTAEEAARFYCDLFPDSSITDIHRAAGQDDSPAMLVAFTLLGQPMTALNGGTNTEFTDAVSFQVHTDTQGETDRYWDALIADGGAEMACSWCKDRFGLRWQIVPRVLMTGLAHENPEARGRVFAAMQGMVKIDHAGIEAAIAGD